VPVVSRLAAVGLQLVDGRDGHLGRVANGGVRQSGGVVDEQDHVAVLQEDVVSEGLLAGDVGDLLDGDVTQAVGLRANGAGTVVAERGDLVVPVRLLACHPLNRDAVDGVRVRVVVAERRLFTGQDVDVA